MNYKSIAVNRSLQKAISICFFLLTGIIITQAQTQTLADAKDQKQDNRELRTAGISNQRVQAMIDSLNRIGHPAVTGYKPGGGPNPFRKGAYRVMLQDFIAYDSYNSYFDGDKTSETTDFTFSPSLDYNIGNGWSIGAGIDYDAITSENVNNNKVETRDWRFSAGVGYGWKVSDNFNLQVRAGTYFGKDKFTFTTPLSSNTEEADAFGYRFSVGSPVYIGNEEIFFVPRLTYMHDGLKYEDEKFSENTYGLTADFVGFPSCEKKHNFTRYYQQGTFIVESHTKFWVQFGNTETDFEDPLLTDQEDDLSDVKLHVDALFYVADYFAVGLDGGIRIQSEKSDQNNFEWNGTTLNFIPRFNVNVPVDNSWKHLYGQIFAGVGSQSSETTIGSNTNEVKYSYSTFGGGIGYNVPITTNLMLTFQGQYQKSTLKEKDSDLKEEDKGLGFVGRVRFTF